MPNRHAQAVARLAQRLKETNPVSITYYRGATAYTVTAFVGLTAFRQTDANNGLTVVQYNDRDYYIQVSDLPVTPRESDYIVDSTIPGVRFNVSVPEGEQAVRYTDGHRLIYVVRTQAENV